MKKILLILPVLLISLCALAATDPQSEKQAEEFYREGKYNEAAEIYRKLRAGCMESAILYYNLGNYLGNNYESCVITAQNALKDYPYTDYREELSILILRARYEMAIYSVEDKKMDRYRETIDEYYAFKNEFPESKYLKEAEKIFNESQKVIKD